MNLKMFAVLDDKVGAYGHPFFCNTNGQAMRMFGDWVRDPKTPLNRHPEDYKLFRIGEFDDQSALVQAEAPPVFLGGAVDYIEQGTLVPFRKQEG